MIVRKNAAASPIEWLISDLFITHAFSNPFHNKIYHARAS